MLALVAVVALLVDQSRFQTKPGPALRCERGAVPECWEIQP